MRDVDNLETIEKMPVEMLEFLLGVFSHEHERLEKERNRYYDAILKVNEEIDRRKNT